MAAPDDGNCALSAKTIASDGKTSDGPRLMASGYSIIKADLLDALSRCKGCLVLWAAPRYRYLRLSGYGIKAANLLRLG
jgi:hypothetical protein